MRSRDPRRRVRPPDVEDPLVVHVLDGGLVRRLVLAEELVQEVAEARALVRDHRWVVTEVEHRGSLGLVRSEIEEPEVARAVRGDRQARGRDLADLDVHRPAGEVDRLDSVDRACLPEHSDELVRKPDVDVPAQGVDLLRHERICEVQLDAPALLVDELGLAGVPEDADRIAVHAAKSMTLRIPSCASISSKPRFTSSSVSLCETNASTPISPAR
jgi:hypothetical protein